MPQYQPQGVQEVQEAINIAAAAREVFPWQDVPTTVGTLPLPVVMTMIAYAESGFGRWKAGPIDRSYRGDGSCGGYGYGGVWQIGLAAHAAWLKQQTGSASPCVWLRWLYDDYHAAVAAYQVYRSQGFPAWDVYRDVHRTSAPLVWYGSYQDAAAQYIRVGQASLARVPVLVAEVQPRPPVRAPVYFRRLPVP